jgi:outer membrane cobalamin receptor
MGRAPVSATKRGASSLLILTTLLGASACASGGASGGSGTSGNPDEITREQIVENSNYSNAMEIIRVIRPRWLRAARGQGTSTFSSGGPVEPVVILDGVRFGELASLRQISLNIVGRMVYLDARDATTLYGTGYMGGAIQIFTLRPD